jgi:hypothetical protein
MNVSPDRVSVTPLFDAVALADRVNEDVVGIATTVVFAGIPVPVIPWPTLMPLADDSVVTDADPEASVPVGGVPGEALKQ